MSARTFLKLILIGMGAILLAEVILRQLPVSGGFYLDNVTVERPVARRVPNQEGVTSIGWNMTDAVHVGINAQGFIYHRDFEESPAKPSIAIIGDSQIEAPLIPTDQSLSRETEGRLNDSLYVYPVGMSGAPLSQYLIWYDYMVRTYKPKAVVFFISPNDYSESFNDYGLFPGFHYFTRTSDGAAELRLREYRRSVSSQIVSLSSLAAYALNNLELIHTLKTFWRESPTEHLSAPAQLEASSAPPEEKTTDNQRMRLSEEAIGLFFKHLTQQKDARPTIHFMMAPESQGSYMNAPDQGQIDQERLELGRLFRRAALANGYTYTDLEPVFREDYRNCGEPLEFPKDVHWNSRGQDVVAGVLSAWISEIFSIEASIEPTDCPA